MRSILRLHMMIIKTLQNVRMFNMFLSSLDELHISHKVKVQIIKFGVTIIFILWV